MSSPVTLDGFARSAAPSPGASSDFSKAFADELQTRLDEEGWSFGNPTPGKSAGESAPSGGEETEHPLLRAGPDDLPVPIRFVNGDDGSPDESATKGQRYAFAPPQTGLTPPSAALLFRDTAPATGDVLDALKPPASEPPAIPEDVPSGPGGALGAFAAGVALRAAGAAAALLVSTVPAGRERETGATADGTRFTADERTIDVRHTDGRRAAKSPTLRNPSGRKKKKPIRNRVRIRIGHPKHSRRTNAGRPARAPQKSKFRISSPNTVNPARSWTHGL